MKKTILLLCSVLLYQLAGAQQVSIPGQIKGLTIMVSYPDYPFNDPVQSISDLMNKVGYNDNGNQGSVRDFYYVQTNGKVIITSTVVKVNLAHPKNYYEANNVNYVDEAIDSINKLHPNGFQGLTPDPVDGKLLHMNFIERTGGGGVTNGASAGKFVKNNTTGVIEIGQGNISSLKAGPPRIATICHEMGHSVMSWTDYYRTAYSNLGRFDLMGMGGTDYAPSPINPALRMQRGWIDNIVNVSGTTTQTYTLTANSYNTIHKYTNPSNPKEYLLFYAYKFDVYYQSPIGNKPMPVGLAIWYVDEETGYDSPVNPSDDNQYYIRLVQADNQDEMHDDFFGATDVSGDMEDLYGNANKSFPNGTPFRWKDGGEFGINITNISNPGATMQFTVNARPNTVVATSDINGTVSPKGVLSVSGQSQTFNFTPNPGYEVDQIKVNGAVVASANPYVLSGISGTKTLSVSFKRKATQAALPSPWQKAAVGNVSSSDFAANAGNNYFLETYANSLTGSEDNFTYLYQVINGNGIYIAHLANYNTIQNSRVGLMIRESLQPNAAYSAITKFDLGGAVVQQRATSGGVTQDNPNDKSELHRYELQNWLKIERNGDHIESFTSKDGSNWYKMGDQIIALPTQVYIGLFTKGNSSTYPSQATFDNISFTTSPAPTASIISPINNAVLTSKSVTITAVATPATQNGSITKVEFYNGSTLIGTDNSAPFSIVWNNAPGGIQTIVAKATDNTGAVAVSTKISVDIPCSSINPKITGTVIGTTGSWNNSGNTREKAFDGDINSYFDANQSVAWTGLRLDTTYKITNIRYVPRQGLEGRMIGGKFEGSNTADFSTGTITLATVLAAPKSGWNCFDVFATESFKYIRYISPEGGVGNVSEIEFYGVLKAANQSPTVAITSPSNGQVYASSATITINANALDADGSIVKVEFYAGVNYLNRDTVAPYSVTLTNMLDGIYSFTAKAYDNEGATAEYTITNVKVGNNTAPVISITSPVTNQSFNAPATITIHAAVTDADNNVWKVDFYNGSTLLGSDYTAPYSYTWNNVPAGVYNITALAIDNAGASASSTRNNIGVIANQPPTVSVTNPLTNASYAAPATIVINADATDADGTIRKVDFYVGSTLLGSDSIAPYSYTWSNVAAGVYNITALAIDNLGAASSSTRNNIGVIANQPPTVSVTNPLTNASYAAPATIVINADATDADGTIKKVDFYFGTTLLGSDSIAPYSYTWNNVPAGVYNITALAIDNLGAASSSTRNNIGVIANQPPTVSVTNPLTNASYAAPATIVINATATDADGSITKVDFYFGSTLLGSDLTAPYSYTWNNVPAGVYNITALAIDNLGAASSSTRNNIAVTAPVADITGPACAGNNTTVTYELAASKRVNATGYGWYFTGSTQSFTPSSYQATLVTGNNYGQGQLCVGVSYASAPYHTTYCITVPKCATSREANFEEVESLVLQPVGFPNPFVSETTISLVTPESKIQVYNAGGVLIEETIASGSFTFGQNLASGMYFVKITAGNKTESLKLVKE